MITREISKRNPTEEMHQSIESLGGGGGGGGGDLAGKHGASAKYCLK